MAECHVGTSPATRFVQSRYIVDSTSYLMHSFFGLRRQLARHYVVSQGWRVWL
jgi:hypothetical protein